MAQGAKRMTKTEILGELSEHSGLSKKEVGGVLEGLMTLAQRELSSKGPGEFVIPDMMKLKVRVTPAQEERQGIDPFTKEPRTFAAKPAQRKVKVTPLKKLKDHVLADGA